MSLCTSGSNAGTSWISSTSTYAGTELIVQMGVWIRDLEDGTRIGFLLADLQGDHLLQNARVSQTLGRDEHLVVIDQSTNRLLVYPQGSNQPIEQAMPGLAPMYPRTKQGAEGFERYTERDEEWLLSYVNVEDLNWTIGVLSRLSVLTGPIRESSFRNLVITFSSILLAIVLIPLIIGRISGSIHQVAAGAEAIANGDLDQKIVVETQDETRVLADSFNRMAQSLKTNMNDLRQLNQDLEDRVRRRTAELEAASQAKSAFLANMSHELRTPMNSIINFSSLILDGVYGEISAEMRDAVEEIDGNSDNLLDLINDVLDLSKIEAGSMQLQLADCVPEVCIENAVTSLQYRATEKELQLLREVEDDLPVLQADERRLTQHVLVNLVKNAIKFTRQGEVRIGARRENGSVVFWVADTGIGIPVQEQEKIFDTFYQMDGSLTREAEGTGLGLAICRRFVEMHGGRIWVESEPEQGSSFFFTIPA